jgi:hypothetical protein
MDEIPKPEGVEKPPKVMVLTDVAEIVIPFVAGPK